MLYASGQTVEVFRNDQIDIPFMEEISPSSLMISPGPGTPEQAGICIEAIRYFGSRLPILGVCLGHQSVVAAYGGKIVRAARVMHGKTSLIHHDGRMLFQDLPNPFEAVRYHSLIVEEPSLPPCLEVSAWTADGEIMAVRHREYPVEGVQFHPESILTEVGPALMENFMCSVEPKTPIS
jgi:para-aminobenzoate synthetase component 2